MNELSNQLASAIAVSQGLEFLKNANWFPFLNQLDDPRWKSFIGFVAALVTSLGVSYTFDYDPSNGGALVLHLPALHTFFDILKQWAFQQFVYSTGVKDKSINFVTFPANNPKVDIQGNHMEGGH